MTITYSLARALSDLRAELRDRGEFRTASITDITANRYLNRGIHVTHEAIATAEPDRFFATSTSVTTVAGQVAYDLPADCGHVTAIAAPDSSTPSGYAALDRADWSELFLDGATVGNLADARVTVRGAKFYVVPAPPSTGQAFRVDYLRLPPTLGADADTWDGAGVPMWDEATICHAAMMAAKQLDRNDVTDWQARRDDAIARITRAARIDHTSPLTVQPPTCYSRNWRWSPR